MQLDEIFMVYSLLVPGRMVFPNILCCVAFIFVMSLILLGIWEALACSEWSDAFPFFVRRQSFGSHILVTQDPLCDLSLVRQELMATVAGNNLQNFAF
jgi:hypothetical protein